MVALPFVCTVARKQCTIVRSRGMIGIQSSPVAGKERQLFSISIYTVKKEIFRIKQTLSIFFFVSFDFPEPKLFLD